MPHSEGKQPNMVFIIADDQRFDTIAALGNPDIITPNLDALVERGTAFTHAHTACGMHVAVCMPSRAALHTGRHVFGLADDGKSIPEEHTMLGEALQAAGYDTFGTGKWHNGSESYARSFSQGAEIFFGGMADPWNTPLCHFDPAGAYDCRKMRVPEPSRSRNGFMFQMDHIHLGTHTTDIFADAAIEFIRDHDSPDPFLAYVAFTAPHDPRSMPEAYLDLYDPDELTLPPNLLPEHPFAFGWRDGRDERLAPYPRTPEIVRRHMADYYAMITHMDEAIGRIVKAVEDRGLLEETLFVITADHGLSLGQHGLFGKQNLYDSSLRIPLVFAGPGVPRGERRDTMVYQMDIFPTLCDSLGLEPPASVTGRSFLPSLVDPDVRHRDRLYFAYRDKMRGVRDERHKLIEYHHEGNRMTQLFDLAEDPWEARNLADDPRYAGKMTDLLAEMTTFRDDWNERDHPLGEEFWSEYERLTSPAARG